MSRLIPSLIELVRELPEITESLRPHSAHKEFCFPVESRMAPVAEIFESSSMQNEVLILSLSFIHFLAAHYSRKKASVWVGLSSVTRYCFALDSQRQDR